MEISDPVPEMIIPVTIGKRTVRLPMRTRAECRELIAAAAKASALLPDDGEGALTLLSDAVKRFGPFVEPSMTLMRIVEALAPMNRSQLRAVIVDAWGWQAAGVEQAISDVQAQAAAVLERSIATGARLTVEDADDMGDDPTDVSGMHDDGLEGAAAVIAPAPGSGEPCACGHHYGAHLYGHGCCLRAGCRCRRYRLAATAAQDEPDEAAILAAGEQYAAEVDEARSRERLSDSAAGPLAEEEPDDGDPQYPDVSGGGVPYPPSQLAAAEFDPELCDSWTPTPTGRQIKCTLGVGHEGTHSAIKGTWHWTGTGPDSTRLSVSDDVRAQMLAELRSRPGYPHGGGLAQTAAQRAMDEQQVDAMIAAGEVPCPCGWTGPGRDSEAHRREHEHADPASVVGTIVARVEDDSLTPLTGRIVGQVDEETYEVAWGDEQWSDTPRTSREFHDALRPLTGMRFTA